MSVDSDHAGCRSRSGFIIYMNITLVQWFPKRYSSVEISVFGAEFVTMKEDIDVLSDLRKLRMMGIPISGSSYVYGYNISAVHNTSRLESVLRKKSNLVCYHPICDSVAMGEFIVGHISSKENVAGIMTKVLYGQKRKYFVNKILYDDH